MTRGRSAKTRSPARALPGRAPLGAHTPAIERELKPGTRVRLRAPAAPLELTSDSGTVIGPAEWDGYYVIKLDRPARYHHADPRVEEIDLVREDVENLGSVRNIAGTGGCGVNG
ncbi:MAG: hypothetical protein HY675_09775 [Chloroflexi bacterium]|nr:hypothetical protein [Chloroflexota bacterium]